jgi:hypothetical protein
MDGEILSKIDESPLIRMEISQKETAVLLAAIRRQRKEEHYREVVRNVEEWKRDNEEEREETDTMETRESSLRENEANAKGLEEEEENEG